MFELSDNGLDGKHKSQPAQPGWCQSLILELEEDDRRCHQSELHQLRSQVNMLIVQQHELELMQQALRHQVQCLADSDNELAELVDKHCLLNDLYQDALDDLKHTGNEAPAMVLETMQQRLAQDPTGGNREETLFEGELKAAEQAVAAAQRKAEAATATREAVEAEAAARRRGTEELLDKNKGGGVSQDEHLAGMKQHQERLYELDRFGDAERKVFDALTQGEGCMLPLERVCLLTRLPRGSQELVLTQLSDSALSLIPLISPFLLKRVAATLVKVTSKPLACAVRHWRQTMHDEALRSMSPVDLSGELTKLSPTEQNDILLGIPEDKLTKIPFNMV